MRTKTLPPRVILSFFVSLNCTTNRFRLILFLDAEHTRVSKFAGNQTPTKPCSHSWCSFSLLKHARTLVQMYVIKLVMHTFDICPRLNIVDIVLDCYVATFTHQHNALLQCATLISLNIPFPGIHYVQLFTYVAKDATNST